MKTRLYCEDLQSDNLQTETECLGSYSLGHCKGYSFTARCPLNWSRCLKVRDLPYRQLETKCCDLLSYKLCYFIFMFFSCFQFL